MSKWGEAERIYERALEHSSNAGDLERVAQVLNNLGYVRHLRGDSPGGLNLCEQALEIWRQLQRPRAEASTLSTVGNIWSKLGNYSEAMASYDAALRIFRDQEDWEWIAIVYHQMAFAQWLQGDRLEEAQQHAEESVRYCRRYSIEKELFTALHRLGHVHMSCGRLQEAQECFEESYQISQKVRDDYRLRDNLLGLAEIAYQKGDYREAKIRVEQALEGIQPEEWGFPALEGGMRRLLGDVLFAQGEYDEALAEYCKAYPKIAQEETFTPYRLSRALESLEERISNLPAELAEQWCDDLRRCWEKRVQEDRGRTELLSFCRVQKLRATRRKVRETDV
jgi:tetratricopeptide (TPR) repeat protein